MAITDIPILSMLHTSLEWANLNFGKLLLSAAIAINLGGCTSFFPSLAGPLGIGTTITDVPVSKVTTDVQCELQEFLRGPNADKLDPKQAANVTLSLVEDNTGTVSYLGVDLSKIGLGSVAEVIGKQGNAPNFQLKGTAKASISSQIDMTVPQNVNTVSKVDCSEGGKRLLTRLFLTKWLNRYFDNVKAQGISGACVSKITLKTQFQLIFDVAAGVNPFLTESFIMPVSGRVFDYSPAFTHTLQIAFSLKKPKGEALCSRLPPQQPNTVIR